MHNRTVSTGEEIANAITHGIGALLAVAGLVVLIVMAAIHGSVWHIVSFSIFGTTLVLLYFASTLYHSLTHVKAKSVFHKFDHISIYLLIAGTYTPFCLTALQGWIGWTVLGVVWSCAILGAVLKAISVGKRIKLSTVLYILMGWVILVAIQPLYKAMPFNGFLFLIAGGISYTIGTIFFIRNQVKYNHSVWHVFVLGGSVLHFFAVLSLLN
ncbi:MAG: hemolysin III family protein [Cytophagales bacterium]|nr:hemolysin III family protein [Cytophagales bacterium]MCA6366031.1 hemolysin III family protein [Cytophagales bacterium]MCA6373123.1 hemolysin III family protein [Cytophagales bacterium]MCA6376004.1 hemolysin III family protein [Cytophagales bacterium]MCA6383451.1 hemolysin III family protein [Cytophagales bacterium]